MHSKEMLQYIAKSLVDQPDAVQVKEVQGERALVLELHVASEDMGKVIGRNGRVIRAIRSVSKAAAIRDGKMIHVEIAD